MSEDVPAAKHYGDLALRQCRSGPGGYLEYDYVGTKAPEWAELENLCDTFMASADAAELWGGGIAHVNGAPTAPEARNCNGLSLTFHDDASFRRFLDRPIPPDLEGVSLKLIIGGKFYFG